MRRLATLILAAGMLLAATGHAQAIDFKVSGFWCIGFDYGQNGNFTGGHGQTGYGTNNRDEFEAIQRLRLRLEAIASESLSGTVFLEIGDTTWGESTWGGALGADGRIVKVKHAYIDWMPPSSDIKVRMGVQQIEPPSFVTQRPHSFGGDTAAVSVNWKLSNEMGVTGFWARPYNDNYTGDGTTGSTQAAFMDNIDLFGIMVPMHFDGVRATPWGMIAALGPNALRSGDNYIGADSSGWGGNWNSPRQGMVPAWGIVSSGGMSVSDVKLNEYSTAWWLGLTADITAFDPWRFAMEFTCGGVHWDESRLNRHGFMVAALLEYRTDWGLPGIVGWYTSGDDSDLGNGSERLPILGNNSSHNDLSHFAFDGNAWLGRESSIGPTMAGTWGLGVRVKDVSYISKLKHDFRVNLIGGTNNHNIFKKLARTGKFTPVNGNEGYGFESLYLTDQDTAMEFGILNEYRMYENFKIFVDANYLALWLADTRYEGVRRQLMTASNASTSETRDAWNISVSFVYEF